MVPHQRLPEEHLRGEGLTLPLPFRAADALFFTGPTGTNVNDLSLVLLRPEE